MYRAGTLHFRALLGSLPARNAHLRARYRLLLGVGNGMQVRWVWWLRVLGGHVVCWVGGGKDGE